MHIRSVTTILAALVVTVAFFLPETKAFAWNYYIDETTDYTNNGCPNITDVNTITSTLATAIIADGKTGSRYVNASALAADFFESCMNLYGQDSIYADNASLTVFAGHGGPGVLAFSYPSSPNSWCNVDFTNNMRLGAMNGAQSGFAMYLGCDALQVPNGLNAANMQWLKQQFGWTNAISIGNNEPRDFYNMTYFSGTINATAWLDQMDGGGRHPMVLTQDNNSANCWASHATFKLRGSVGMSPAPRGGGPACFSGPPSFWFCTETR